MGAPRIPETITFSNQFYSKYYYGRRTMLSIGNVLPLRGILEGAIVCNVEHHIGDRGVFARASRDYTIMISHNPDNVTSMGKLPGEVFAEASRDYAIVISHNPNNSTSTGT